jgi:hypothetical protein
MSTTTIERVDLANGVDPAREYALRTEPPADKFRFAENFMLAVYDPVIDLGMWLHLGTCPDDFALWEEQVLMTLPGDGGFLWTRASSRPSPDQRPSGPNMQWDVIEPFAKMHVAFDGIGIRTPYADMMAGRVRDAKQELFAIDLQVKAIAPAWDNHVSAAAGGARGSMTEQSWASEHYQQTLRATGTVRIDGKTLTFDGTGVRDHSRGQRGHKPWGFGGHNLWSAPFASGKAFGMQRMWTPDFQGTLNVGFIYLDGQFHHTDLITRPAYLEHIALSGDPLELVMRSPLGEHRITGVLKKTIFCTFGDPWGYHFGADLSEPRGLFVPGFAEFTWDGETSYGLAERSGPVGKLPA